MEYRCPHCNAPIYSRKSKICGGCEKPLAEAQLLSERQIAILRQQDEAMEKRAREFNPEICRGSGDGSSGMI